jgi:hypothetical protein
MGDDECRSVPGGGRKSLITFALIGSFVYLIRFFIKSPALSPITGPDNSNPRFASRETNGQDAMTHPAKTIVSPLVAATPPSGDGSQRRLFRFSQAWAWAKLRSGRAGSPERFIRARDNITSRPSPGNKEGLHKVMPQLRGDIDQLGSAATKPKRRQNAALQGLSRFTASRQTGECLGSGLPFGVRRRRRRFGSRRPVNSPQQVFAKSTHSPVTEALLHKEGLPAGLRGTGRKAACAAHERFGRLGHDPDSDRSLGQLFRQHLHDALGGLAVP